MPSDIVAALRVKNEERWLAEVLEALTWCDDIYLFDDHSTDTTRAIARNAGAFIIESPFHGLDEARDKEHLLKRIREKRSANTWILFVDGDEILERGGEQKIRESIMGNPKTKVFQLQIKYLWNLRDLIRVDGVYGRFSRPSLFVLGDDFAFKKTSAKGNLHCSSVPECLIKENESCPAILLHLGYMDRKDRLRKWEYYNSIDSKNRLEGYDPAHPERRNYPHMVQGDVPEVPAEIKLLHAGPLKLETFMEKSDGPENSDGTRDRARKPRRSETSARFRSRHESA